MLDEQLKTRYTELYEVILKEHREVFAAQDLKNLQEFIELLAAHERIFVMGVGREGIAARSFAMRLMHLGKEVHWIWDDTTPGMHEGDLFLAVNGSANIGSIQHDLGFGHLRKVSASVYRTCMAVYENRRSA